MDATNNPTNKSLLSSLTTFLSNNDNIIRTLVNNASQQSVRSSRLHTVENFLLTWLNSNIQENDKDFSNSCKKLQEIVNRIDVYKNVDECIDFITDITHEYVFVIISGSLGQQIISFIHDISQIDSIYVFCQDISKHVQWTHQWPNIKGIFTDIQSICEALQQHTRQCEQDSTSIRISNAKNANQLDPTFMYTALFKEIILGIQYDEQAIHTLANECRQNYLNNEKELKIIKEFEDKYYEHSSIWWYTRECFTYHMLNRILRTFEMDIIVSMGVFIQHLHRRIEQLQSEQKDSFERMFIVYRGQGLSNIDFDELKQSYGGLLSFNNFLSTSRNRNISYSFTRRARKADHVGILFRMVIDSSTTTSPFAQLDTESFFKEIEQEILFSMNSVFRIGQLKQTETSGIFEVELTLTTPDTDELLQGLTERLRTEVEGSTGWHQLGHLLRKSGHYKKAEELYQFLLQRTPESDYKESSHLNHMLAITYTSQNKYEEAIKLHVKAIEIEEKFLQPNDLDFATSYRHLGDTYARMSEYIKALQFFGKALEIRQKLLHPDHPDLAISYMDIGRMHHRMGEFTKVLEYYTKSLEIRQKSLPSTSPDVAMSYIGLGILHAQMGEFIKALGHLQKSHEIYKKSLPPYHPELFISYMNLGLLHLQMGEGSKALDYYEKAIEISEKSLPSDDLELAKRYNDVGIIFCNSTSYVKALEYCTKSLEIRKKSLPSIDPFLATSYTNVGVIYMNMREFTKALECCTKAVEIYEKVSPPTYVDMDNAYVVVCNIYENMQQPLTSLEYAEKSIKTKEKYLPPSHFSVVSIYMGVATKYSQAKNYSKALEYYLKIEEILKKSGSSNNPDLSWNYKNISFLYHQMGDYAKAFQNQEKAIEINEKFLPSNHPDLIASYVTFSEFCMYMCEDSKAIECCQKLLTSYQNSLPSNDLAVAQVILVTGWLFHQMGEYSTALQHYETSLEIFQKLVPPDYSSLFTTNVLISELHIQMGESSKAQLNVTKFFNIQQMIPDLFTNDNLCVHLGKIYRLIKDYSKARASFETALEIRKRTCPETSEFVAEAYSNIGDVQRLTGDYSNAVLSLRKALQIQENRLCRRLDLALTYNYLGETYRAMKNYSAALEFHKKALQIRGKVLSLKHPDLAETIYNLAKIYIETQQYQLAYEHVQRAIGIARQTLPSTHPHLIEYTKVLTYLQQNFH